MLNYRKYLLPISVAVIATINIASPALAAKQIVLKLPGSLTEWQLPMAELEDFVLTGDTEGLPEGFVSFMNANGEIFGSEKIQNQFKRPISIDSNAPLNSFSEQETAFLKNLLMPNSTEAELEAALKLMAAKGNDRVLIDFLKALPGETITANNFIETLTAYQVTPIKPPTPEPEPIDLRTWSNEGGPGRGNWVLSADGTFVRQTFNGYPTFFVSPETFINTTVNGKFKVEDTEDNDFIGFVFGYQSPTAVNSDEPNNFDLLLFDWKKSFDRGHEGFALTKVNGIFATSTSDEYASFWQHQESSEFDILATDYGIGKGWRPYQEYDFTLLYQSDRIKIDIDGNTIFDIAGEFEPGRFGFYNYSQPNVRYSGFSQTETIPVPEPASIVGLLGFSILAAGAKLKRQRSKARGSHGRDAEA